MEILCENPVLIFNEKFKWCLLSKRCYYRDGQLIEIPFIQIERYYYKFPYYLFTKKYCCAEKQLDFVYTFDDFGEIVPAYIKVPCGKCALCRDKKTREWRIRAVAETQTSTSVPIFVTLTYKDAPVEGVSKDEIQRFLKRVRITLDRKGVHHNLRYFACGEYGKLSGRPHYHLIIWNWPADPMLSASGIPLQIQADRILRPAWNKGFIYVRQSDYGSISYVMKYMRKGVQSPIGCNEGFFLSSRKNGGLGAEWLRLNKQYFIDNPHVLTMTVTDKYTGKSFEAFLPRYFRDKIFPPHSKAISRNAIIALNLLNTSCLYRRALEEVRLTLYDKSCPYVSDALDVFHPIYSDKVLTVFEKFQNVYRFHRFVSVPSTIKIGIIHNLSICGFEDLISQTEQIMSILMDFLRDYSFDDNHFVYLQRQKDLFNDRVNLVFGDKTLTREEIDYSVEQLCRSMHFDYLKEQI